MTWTLDTPTPTLDAGVSAATLDGWSAALAIRVKDRTSTVATVVQKQAVISTERNVSACLS